MPFGKDANVLGTCIQNQLTMLLWRRQEFLCFAWFLYWKQSRDLEQNPDLSDEH